jgi:hypothetical protein
VPNVRGIQSSFNGGVVTPEFWGRIDDAKYQSGMSQCDNFVVLPHGPIQKCPGTQYVNNAKSAATKSRLIPFTYSTTQTAVIELAVQSIRIHSQGKSLLSPVAAAYNAGTTYNYGDLVSLAGINYYSRVGANTGNNPPASPVQWYPQGTYYEIPSPYLEADLFAITYVQSADVLTLCHQNYPPMELRRVGATNWQLIVISFGSILATPTLNSVTATRGSPSSTATKVYSYEITSATADGKSESPVSSIVASGAQNLLDAGAYNTLAWTGAGARFNVYRLAGGLYGFIGAATTGAYVDDGLVIPDTGTTPPIPQFPFATDYPAAVSYFEQRRLFGGTPLNPQKVWGTRSGTESDLAYSIPVRADDAISFKVASRDVNTIRHIVPMQQVILLTSGGVWRLSSSSGGPVTPSTISIASQSGVGANAAQPIVDDVTAIYISARGGHMRELGYSWQTQGFLSSDLSLRAPHLFDGNDIIQLAIQRSPSPTIWGVSTAGNLIGMAYVPEEDVRGFFTRSTTNGFIESMCVVAEGVEDRLYMVVRRVINGATVRYVERMAPRLFGTLPNAVFADCAGFYSGVPTLSVSGLTWLEGQLVSILGDGAVFPPQLVTGGTITLTEACSVIQVGLPVVSQMQTLPAGFAQTPGAGQGRPKNVNRVFFRVTATGGLKAGPDFYNLIEMMVRTTENFGSPPNLVNDEVQIDLTPSWSTGGQIVVYHVDPLPCTVLSMTPEYSVGS